MAFPALGKVMSLLRWRRDIDATQKEAPGWLIPRCSEQTPAAEPKREIPRGVFRLLMFANRFNGMGAVTWPGLPAVVILGWALLGIAGSL